MIDYTKLRKKLAPDQDGEPPTHLRTATVDAVNSDGTVDLLMASGVIVPDVPKLASAYTPDGSVVQVISLRGSLLVLGVVADRAPMSPQMVKTGSTTTGPSGATLFTTAVSFGVTFPAAPNVHVNMNTSAGATANWHVRAYNISTTGFTIYGFGPSNTFSTGIQWTAIYSP
jgi:hypothetical protein